MPKFKEALERGTEARHEQEQHARTEKAERDFGAHIIGFLLQKARETGPDVQTLAYTHIKAYEQRLAAGHLA
jgi:hypothetical protein